MAASWWHLGLIVAIAMQSTTPAQETPVRLVTQTAAGLVNQIAVAPDGQRLVALEADFIRFWDVASGREWRRIYPQKKITKFRVHPYTKQVVAYADFSLISYDIDRGVETSTCKIS